MKVFILARIEGYSLLALERSSLRVSLRQIKRNNEGYITSKPRMIQRSRRSYLHATKEKGHDLYRLSQQTNEAYEPIVDRSCDVLNTDGMNHKRPHFIMSTAFSNRVFTELVACTVCIVFSRFRQLSTSLL